MSSLGRLRRRCHVLQQRVRRVPPAAGRHSLTQPPTTALHPPSVRLLSRKELTAFQLGKSRRVWRTRVGAATSPAAVNQYLIRGRHCRPPGFDVRSVARSVQRRQHP
jgi:hypothetical protein